MRSFEKEYERNGKTLNLDLGDEKSEAANKAFKTGRDELRRLMTLREKPAAVKQPVKRPKTKSVDKTADKPAAKKYDSVKSRLFRTNEATRMKKTTKYENPHSLRDVKRQDKENVSNSTFDRRVKDGSDNKLGTKEMLESFHKQRSIISKGT